ncbi:MAG: hypothetical protein ACXVWU_04590 [Nocardioides sp.]
MRRSLLRAHAVVTVVGLVLLVWTAVPLYWTGVQDAFGRGVLLWGGTAALALGGFGGLVEGFLARAGRTPAAVAVLVATSVPALWVAVLFNGRWTAPDDGPIASDHLASSVASWLMFAGVVTGVAVALAGPSSTAEAEAPAREDDAAT